MHYQSLMNLPGQHFSCLDRNYPHVGFIRKNLEEVVVFFSSSLTNSNRLVSWYRTGGGGWLKKKKKRGGGREGGEREILYNRERMRLKIRR